MAVEKRNKSRRRSGEGNNIPVQEGTPEEVRRKTRKRTKVGTERA